MENAIGRKLKYHEDRIHTLFKKVCRLEESTGGGTETDPIFSASPSFDILSSDINNWNDAASLAHEHANMVTLSGITAQKVINWDNAFSWGNPSGTYVPIAGPTTITGEKTFSETLSVTKSSNTDDSDSVSITGTYTHSAGVGNGITISPTINQTGTGGYNALLISPFEQAIGAGGGFLLNIGTNTAAGGALATHSAKFVVDTSANLYSSGNFIPDVDNTRKVGDATLRYIMYPSVVAKGATGASLNFAAVNLTTSIFARFHPTTHNFILQAAGSAGADTGERLQVQGTTLLSGNTSIVGNLTTSGNIVPTADATQIIGGVGLRYILYASSIYKGNAASGIQFSVSGSGTDVFARFHSTSHNLTLQASGSTPTDLGERLQVMGTSRFAGNTVVPNTFTSSWYNTTDETTNYERLRIYWSSNIITLGAEGAGTGSARTIRLASGTRVLAVNSALGAGIGFVDVNNSSGTAGAFFSVRNTTTASTGIHNNLLSIPTINQTSTAGYNALYISPFEQATGSGAKYLINAGTNSAADNGGAHTLRFSVSNTGLIFATAPTYADNAAAITGGLIAGNIYKTATGELRIVV